MRSLLQNELKENRTELSAALKENREELSDGLDKLTLKLDEKLTQISEGLNTNAKANREELNNSLKDFSTIFTKNVKDFNDLQKQKFDAMATKQDLNNIDSESIIKTLIKILNLSKSWSMKPKKIIEASSLKIKKKAMEFAKLGMSGIDPNKKNYEVPSLNKQMSGYQTLAYYYVSWAIAIPDMLPQLQMPFDKEYELAKRINN